jgi:hypothetical protein
MILVAIITGMRENREKQRAAQTNGSKRKFHAIKN